MSPAPDAPPETKVSPHLIVPPSIARLRSPVGVHRRGMKVLAFGEPKSGKSFLLAHMPHPIYAIDAGEGGIQEYLDHSLGDECFESTNPESFLKLVEFAIKHEDHFNSLAVDPATTTWDEWMDFWSNKFGGQITGPQWNQVKGPWKIINRQIMRSKLNVGYSAWLKDILFERKEVAPGIEGKLNIRPVELPSVERKTPYHMDIMLQTSIVRDEKNRPTPRHRITLTGGRRPKTVNPEEFFVGKTWDFNAKKPVNPWKVIVQPIAEQWDNGAVDYLGLDEKAINGEDKDLEKLTAELTVGQLVSLIEKQTDMQEYKDRVWPNEIQPIIDELGEEYKGIVINAHEAAKRRLCE